jgi:CHASE2 domain-containing sensor protein
MGGLLTIIWGIAHLIPTEKVIKGFGNITADNIRIIRMEWINEGLTLIFMGLLTIICTILNNSENRVIKAVYFLTFSMLLAMSVLSLNTGFKINFLPFKLCPLIFMVSGLLILQGVRFGKTNHYSN